MSRNWDRLLLVVVSVLLTLIGLCWAPAGAQPPSKVEPAVASALRVHGSTDFFVRFAERADLSAVAGTAGWNARGEAAVAALRETADRSQAAARRLLDAAGASYQAFWASNTILVRNGSAGVAAGLNGLAGVTQISAPAVYRAPEPAAGAAGSTSTAGSTGTAGTAGTAEQVDAVEWGIAAIGADQVWSAFGVRGEGVVVANIDTGVDFDHPALVGQYRGNLGGGSFDHDHNWFDPSGACPSPAPCDNNNHGTHTMGTLVGDDGAGNQIGVAPGARWIAAKGCESFGCSEAALLASGQWMLAPTDASGANPRPDLRPHVINNSWGAAGNDQWYRDIVIAWRAAGIFPAFAVSGSGPGCGTIGSPADYPESYATGAFDINGNIAPFSGRGPAGDLIKPDIAAPGVNVRSAINGGGYLAFSGTSMASPHTAGAAALVLSAAPSLIGDVTQTIAVLDGSAIDTSDLTCGGTAEDNNVWGEGRLDAFAAVTLAPRGPVGVLAGTVSSAGGAAIAGARVRMAGPVERETTTNAAGAYSATLPIGDYTVTASAFGYRPRVTTVTITEGVTSVRDLRLRPAPSYLVRGVVSDTAGRPLAGATVTIAGTPLAPAVTAADGSYGFPEVPAGTYQFVADGGRCTVAQTTELTLNRDRRLDFALPVRSDSFGYTCSSGDSGYVEGDTPLALTGDDTSVTVSLPFAFPFYGGSYTQAFVSSNGNLNFLAPSTSFSNTAIPSAGAPNAAVYPFWDDLLLDAGSAAFTRNGGGSLTIEWRNVTFFGATSARIDVQVELFADGQIAMRYRNLDPAQPRELGSSATIGIENATGTIALQFSVNVASLSNLGGIRFRPPAPPS